MAERGEKQSKSGGSRPSKSRRRPRPSRTQRDSRKIAQLQAGLNEVRGEETRILIVGRTGVGKSSLINSIVGAEIADTGKHEPTTAEIYSYLATIRGAPLRLIDTPGFCDARNRANDAKYLDLISALGELDLIVFVTKLDDTRVETGEYDTLESLTERFSEDLWERALVVLTRSDRVPRSEYREELVGRTDALRKAMIEVMGDVAATIPMVPISNRQRRNPDKRNWMTHLWLTMLKRMGQHGFESFVLATINRLEQDDEEDQTAADVDSVDEFDDEFDYLSEPHVPSVVAPAKTRPRKDASALATGMFGTALARIDPAPKSVPAQTGGGNPAAFAHLIARPLFETTPEPVASEIVQIPDPVTPSQTIQATRNDYIYNDVHVVEKTVRLDRGVGAITMNHSQLTITQNIIEHRAPQIFDAIRVAAGWVAKKVRKFFFGA